MAAQQLGILKHSRRPSEELKQPPVGKRQQKMRLQDLLLSPGWALSSAVPGTLALSESKEAQAATAAALTSAVREPLAATEPA